MALPLVCFNMYCPDGGIGRHAGLRSQYFGVRVRVSLGAPNNGVEASTVMQWTVNPPS